MSVIETAKKVLQQEAEAVLSLQEKLDNNFEKAVDFITSSRGRVVLTGMGKSGHIAKRWRQRWLVLVLRLFLCILRKLFMAI